MPASLARKSLAIHVPQLPQALLNAFETNDRIHTYLIEDLPAAAWRANPADGKGRTLAAIVAHMHNVRVMWLKGAKANDIPAQLERATVTPAQAVKAMTSSCEALHAWISTALKSDGLQLSSRRCRFHRLSDRARFPSSRASDDACPTTRASLAAESDVRDAGVG